VTSAWNANDIAHGTPGTELAPVRRESPNSAGSAVEPYEHVEIRAVATATASATPHVRFAHESSRSW
jgi:hypothetical protein